MKIVNTVTNESFEAVKVQEIEVKGMPAVTVSLSDNTELNELSIKHGRENWLIDMSNYPESDCVYAYMSEGKMWIGNPNVHQETHD